MKKTLLALALSLPIIGTNAFASNNDPYDFNDEFKGWFIGGEVNTARYNDLKINNHYINIPKTSRGAGFSIIGGFGFSFGTSNFIGHLQERIGFGNASLEGYGEKLKEQFSSSISYLQGYKITDTIMPYAKVSYDFVYFDTNEKYISSGFGHGVGFGGGVKFALSEHLELGVEYTRMNLEGHDDIKLKGDNIALNLGYRF
ncbi:outer membrane beta-barrel protein [Aggregatibacter kilianii]|uniref:outer membrane beta-barrel protein n=1 Tax=Aggregatibacter kilianii TaxID=2025884 RepID=UPI000D65DBE7|nr:outer membrane beta-barrel protein [Aggregatibacter kilianii]